MEIDFGFLARAAECPWQDMTAHGMIRGNVIHCKSLPHTVENLAVVFRVAGSRDDFLVKHYLGILAIDPDGEQRGLMAKTVNIDENMGDGFPFRDGHFKLDGITFEAYGDHVLRILLDGETACEITLRLSPIE